MVRIMTADELTSTTITVDGTLSGEGIEPVQSCCIQALAKGKPVRLHLRDVSAIDECGRTMLRHLAVEGVDLTANGIYSSYIVDEIQSAGLSKRRCSR
jgi:ABC-type transporter Mla MlaB component